MLRIVFMGTPAFSVPMLSEIVAAGHQVAAVYAQPPRRAGRGMKERPSPVHAFAEEAGLPVFTPTSLRTGEAQETFAGHAADVAVVVAYGLILPKPILDAPVHGCLNMHASALPRWRGAAPIQRAIMAGDTETAAMVMRMEEGLDTGPVCLAERVEIGENTTAGELHDTLSLRGADLMVRALAALERGSLNCRAQPDDGITYAEKIDKQEAEIDFTRPAQEVHNHIRGLSPFPGAWTTVRRTAGGGDGGAGADGQAERVKVLESRVADGTGAPGAVLDENLTIACGDGAVRLVTLQRAGKQPLPADAFLRGCPLEPGDRLG